MNFLSLFIKSLKYISKGTNYLIKYLSASTRFQFITKYFILISEYLNKYRIFRFLKYFKIFIFVRFIIRILATINLVFSCIILYIFSDFTFSFDWIALFSTSSIFLDSLIMDGKYIKNSIIDYIKNATRRSLRELYNKTAEKYDIHNDIIDINAEIKESNIDKKDNSKNYTKYIIIGISVVVLAYVGYNYHNEITEVIISSGLFKYILDYFKKDDKGKGKATDSNLPLPDIINIPSTSDPLFNDNPSGSTTKQGFMRSPLRIDVWGWIKKGVGKIWSPSDKLSPNTNAVLNEFFHKPDTTNLGGIEASSSNYPTYPAEVPINPQVEITPQLTPQVEISTQATPQVEISTQATPQVEANNSPTSTGSITPTATATPSYTRPFPNLGEELPRYEESSASTSASGYVDPFDPV